MRRISQNGKRLLLSERQRRSYSVLRRTQTRFALLLPMVVVAQMPSFVCRAQLAPEPIRRRRLFDGGGMRNVAYIAVSHPASIPRMRAL